MNLHKDVTPSFVCDQCGGSYSTLHTLKEHINDKHTKKKVHSCEVCQREFTNRHLYRNHVVTHSEDRPFACTICTKAFKLKTNLMRHTKRNHGTSSANGADAKPSKAKRKHPSSDKDESNSSTMTPPPVPQKKPFQPFSVDSPFYKNNQSIQFQSSNSNQTHSDVLSVTPDMDKPNSVEMPAYTSVSTPSQKAQMPEQFHMAMSMKQSPQPVATSALPGPLTSVANPTQNYYNQYFEQSPSISPHSGQQHREQMNQSPRHQPQQSPLHSGLHPIQHPGQYPGQMPGQHLGQQHAGQHQQQKPLMSARPHLQPNHHG